MKTRNQYLADKLQEVLLDGRWIANTNYKDQIRELDWQQAIQKVGNLNTIAALTFHINYYLEGILNAFETGELTIRDRFSYDMPPINNAQDWGNLINNFLDNSEKFIKHIRLMTDNQLDEPFMEEKYGSILRNIEGMIEHSYYHLGQIVLIKKLTSEN